MVTSPLCWFDNYCSVVSAGNSIFLVTILLSCFKAVYLLNLIFIILLYMSFYLKCTVMSYYFVVLLKQTTEVKTLPIAPVTQFRNS